jgi:hypothetical protein
MAMRRVHVVTGGTEHRLHPAAVVEPSDIQLRRDATRTRHAFSAASDIALSSQRPATAVFTAGCDATGKAEGCGATGK